jgi:phage terminase large subunit
VPPVAVVEAPNPLDDFIVRYGNEPVLFVQEVLGAEPDEYQAQVLRWIAAGERQISVRSGHGVGKTTTLAFAIVWFACTRFPQKTVCTAPTSTQLYEALAAETKAWFKKLPPVIAAIFEIQVDQIRHRAAPEESFVSFATSKAEQPEALAGKHSENILLIADEASGIPDPVFEAARGSMSGPHATMILAGNPVRGSGLFYRSHTALKGFWKTLVISCVNHPRVSKQQVEEMARDYGVESNAYRVRVLGEFPEGDDDTIIPREYAESALFRDVKPTLVRPVWGVDVARFGSDSSALARRGGNVLLQPVEIKNGYDTMQVAGWVHNEWLNTPESERPTDINIDVIGIGAGVVDRLMELGLPVRGVNVSESPAMTDQYTNLRTELWFKGNGYLGRKDCNLAGDQKLADELAEPRFKYTSTGKKQAESKDDMKKRGVRSPNRADAFLLTLASEAISLSNGTQQRKSWAEPLRRKIKGIV